MALAITRGFGDALRIGYQARPEIFARHIVLPEQPYEAVVEIVERVGADGEVVTALNEEAARAELAAHSRKRNRRHRNRADARVEIHRITSAALPRSRASWALRRSR